MVRVNEIYDLVFYMVNKDQQGNNLNSDEFNVLLKAVNIGFFKQRYGLPEEYQPGTPLPKMSYEITQKITDDLRALKVRMGIDSGVMIVNAQGMANIPSNYVHFSSAHYKMITTNTCGDIKYKVRAIEHLTDGQINDRRGDSIKMPTHRNPVYTTYSTYFQFYPEDLRNVFFTYLRMPVTPFYNTSISKISDTENYLETGSVHFEYPEDCYEDIARMICSYIGINLRSTDLINYSEMKMQKGV